MSSLDDIDELNQAVGLSGERKLVPFSTMHIQMMELGEHDSLYFQRVPHWLTMLEGMANLGYAFTGVKAGRPYCSFGIMKMWPGVAEMWLIPDANLAQVTHSFHRAARKFTDICMSELHLVRLQVTIHTQNVPADIWIRRMLFEEEGVLRGFGPDGSDYKMYSRLERDNADDGTF